MVFASAIDQMHSCDSLLGVLLPTLWAEYVFGNTPKPYFTRTIWFSLMFTEFAVEGCWQMFNITYFPAYEMWPVFNTSGTMATAEAKKPQQRRCTQL